MNKIFFKFATFWWFCLLDCFLRFHCLMCLLSVSHFVISAWQFVTVLVWDPCSRFETFFSICMSWRDFPAYPRISQASFLGDKGWHVHFLRTPYIKSAKFTRVQSLLLFRCFQTTPMNAITCAEMFYSIPNEQQASDLRKPSRANRKSAFDYVCHCDSKAEVKVATV